MTEVAKPATDASKLLNLFDRPTEPVFMPKGQKDEVFDVPANYLAERYRPLQTSLMNRFGIGDSIEVKKIHLPDISSIQALDRRENFSLFIPHHAALADRLVNIFMAMKDVDDLLSAAVYCRDRVNPFLFHYCLCVAMLHREDTKHLELPPVSQTFPEKFVDSQTFGKAREEVNIVQDTEVRVPVAIPKDYTANDLEIEHRLAYFREDLGINLHHWHWHLIYPSVGDRSIVNKDRRGELFYYMHHQILARYNVERFCNNMPRVARLSNLREPIPEGYFPKMDSQVSSRNWPARKANTILTDIARDSERLNFDIHDLEIWSDRIYNAIHSGFAIDEQGKQVSLMGKDGIDILGNMVESSILSINKKLYGNLHNLGHDIIAFSHDPDHRHLEGFGIMGDPATAMRDPVFYRWHACIDNMFIKYKNTLPPYTYKELDFPGVKVTGIETVTEDPKGNLAKNRLFTFWQESDVDMSSGLDYTPRGMILARFTHLQHSEFVYNIAVESPAELFGTVRIFLAPIQDERGVPMILFHHKNYFIEMDRFVTKLKRGKNVITRRSSESTVTIPFERTFSRGPVNSSPEAQARWEFCSCGWPQHMLIPKGTHHGFPVHIFVMVSDYKIDRVGDPMVPNASDACKDASSFCGLRDRKYPDSRAMGFPFDRAPRDGADSLSRFLTPNMAVQDVNIFFNNRTVQGPSYAPHPPQ